VAPARRTVHRQDSIKAGSLQEGGVERHQPLGRLQVIVQGRFMNRMVPMPGRGDDGGVEGGRQGKGSADGRRHDLVEPVVAVNGKSTEMSVVSVHTKHKRREAASLR
jgi:hypothetical protein